MEDISTQMVNLVAVRALMGTSGSDMARAKLAHQDVFGEPPSDTTLAAILAAMRGESERRNTPAGNDHKPDPGAGQDHRGKKGAAAVSRDLSAVDDEAVCHEPRLLERVAKPTYEICLLAAQRDGLALQFVPAKHQTTELVMRALRENREAIQYVHNMTCDLERALKSAGMQSLITLFDQLKYQRGSQVRQWAVLNRPDGSGWSAAEENAIRAMEG